MVVYGRFLDDQLPVAMDVMADMLLTPTFADLDREREVVLEEIAMVEDSPQDLIHDVLAEVVLDGHPLAHPDPGHAGDHRRSLRGDIRGYHDQRFQFSDMVVAAAGNVSTMTQLRELLLERQRHERERQRRSAPTRSRP